MTDRHRVPAAGRRRRLRHRLPDAGRQRARRDRPPGARDREGHRRRRPRSRRTRGAPDRSWACSRRRRTPATSSCGSSRAAQRSRSSEEIISRPAATAARGRAARRDRVRPAAAGHARRSRRQPDADRGEDLRRRSRACSTELAEPVEEMLEQDRRRRRRRRHAARQPGGRRGPSIRSRPAAYGLTVEQVSHAAVGRLARRGGHRSAAARSHASRCACGCPTRSGSIRASSPQTLMRTQRRQARAGVGARARRRGRTGSASCCARTCGRWRSSAAGSRDATSAAPSPRSRRSSRELKLPVGYTYEIGGQYESQRQAFRELLMVFGIAAVLVFTILVVQFRAFMPALLILAGRAAVARRRAAAAAAHRHRPERLVGDGADPAVGLVVKNGIMLLDYCSRAARRRASRSRRRLRTPAASGCGRS